MVAIKGVTITRGGREWQVASTVRTGAGLRLTLKAPADPECRILAGLPPGMLPERASDLAKALSEAEARWFRDQSRSLWKVTFKPVSGVGTAPGGWLVFSSDTTSARARIRYDGVEGIGELTDSELVRQLFLARKNPE